VTGVVVVIGVVVLLVGIVVVASFDKLKSLRYEVWTSVDRIRIIQIIQKYSYIRNNFQTIHFIQKYQLLKPSNYSIIRNIRSIFQYYSNYSFYSKISTPENS